MNQTVLLLDVAGELDTRSFDLETLLSSPSLFLEASPEDTLDSVLTNVESSHEPVLVFNDQHFEGLVSLQNTLYQSRLPHGTKIKRALLNPPKLSFSSSIYDIAKAMQSTRVYALPVFSDGSVAGIIELATVLKWIGSNSDNLKLLSSQVAVREPSTVHKSANVQEVLEIFRKESISRVIVVGDSGAIEGIVTRRHLRKAFMTPSNRQRFSATDDPATHIFDPAEVIRRGDLPLQRLYQGQVFEARNISDTTQIVSQLIESNYNSIVITDRDRRPVGFVSNKDLLKAIISLQPPELMDV